MKLKNIIITISVLLVFGGLLAWSYEKNGSSTASVQGVSAPEAKSFLTATSTVYDFGTISMKDGDVHQDFAFTNQTASDITIRDVESSCMCTSALLVEPDGSTKGPFGMPGMGGMTAANDIVKAGESRTVRVTYDPNAHGPAGVGAIDRFVTVTDASGGTLRFEIKALVTP